MKVALFHVPYVDDDGVGRQRLCAAVTGISEDEDPEGIAKQLAESLRAIEAGSQVLMFTGPDVTAEWL